MDVSVVIPARNEEWLQRTVEDVLEGVEADTEIIVVCDGSWPEPRVLDHPRVNVVHFTVARGQRAAVNAGVRLSEAKYVMKLDAHCAVDKGFDRKLMSGCQRDWTLVPRMYNLHVFDWECEECGWRKYQGGKPEKCGGCGGERLRKALVWEPRWARQTLSWRFDKDLHFQYWNGHRRRRETRRGEYIETMSFIGACWFMERERYWELEGLDEGHGSWGQVGTEVACKSWLSGGKLLTAKGTWFAHFFRVGGMKFPYPITGNQQERAREYSRKLWLNNAWKGQKYPLRWLVEKFSPVPGWEGVIWDG